MKKMDLDKIADHLNRYQEWYVVATISVAVIGAIILVKAAG